MEELARIGSRIRRLRKAAEMTQEDLAERSDLTAGFISQVERGKTSISIDSLLMILNALNVHISDFFRQEQEQIVFKAKDAVLLERDGVEKFESLVSGAANRTMEPVKVLLEEGQTVEMPPFSGEQFGYILRGELRLSVSSQQFRAKAGDSFYAEGTHTLELENKNKRPVEFLWVTSPPYF